MKLIKMSLLGAALALVAGCASGTVAPATPSPAPSGEQPANADPLLTADGLHFAASRTYQGECMPAGSRGGCYSITLEPDGSYRHMLLDAPVGGTYVVDKDEVRLTPTGDMEPSTMALSADRTRLGDYVFQAAVEP